MNGPNVMAELADRQMRVRHLEFKRVMWLAEALILLTILVVLFGFQADPMVRTLLLGLQTLRVISELLNHYHLGIEFAMADKWHLFPFF